jgi:hypothetical protein
MEKYCVYLTEQIPNKRFAWNRDLQMFECYDNDNNLTCYINPNNTTDTTNTTDMINTTDKPIPTNSSNKSITKLSELSSFIGYVSLLITPIICVLFVGILIK